MKNNLWKDFKVHVLLVGISMFVICKFSPAPALLECLIPLLQRPAEDTLWYEFFRVAENLSLAYIASLIFYVLVDYCPRKRDEMRSAAILEKPLVNLYMNMNKVISYYKFRFDTPHFSAVTEEKKKEINDFSFSTIPEFLFVESTRDQVHDGGHVEWFDAKKEVTAAGIGISKSLAEIDSILAGNKAPTDFISLMNELRTSGFLEKLLKIMPGPPIIVAGKEIPFTYLNFYDDICKFEVIQQKIEGYTFLKLGYMFRRATESEIVEWIDYQRKIRVEYPEVDEIMKQLGAKEQ